MIEDQFVRENILQEIRRTASDNDNKPLGILQFEATTGIKSSEWKGRFWARWSEAVKEAGLTPNTMNEAIPEDFLLEVYCLATRHYGKAPTRDELSMFTRRHEGYPEKTVFQRRFGTIGKLRGLARTWASKRGEFDDVVSLLPKWIEPAKKRESNDPVVEGYVYLLKSGIHYKIGRSDNLEKRIKQISVAMPEEVSLVHAIKTDDPSGIETYWHRRFSEHRANGEWFNLPVSALKAFKRRKFQ